MMLKKTKKIIFIAALTILTHTAQAESKSQFYYKSIAEITNDRSMVSSLGQPFQVIQLGKKNAKHRFFIQGGLHGNELLPPEFVLWLANRFKQDQGLISQLKSKDVSIDFLPIANPDGHKLESRYNPKGVNLNRNFGTLWGVSKENPGSEKFSENETKAIKKLFETRKYAASIDIHGYVNWIVGPSQPFYINDVTTDVQRQRYSRWVEALKKNTNLLDNYEFKTAGGLGDGGAFEDWAFWEQNTLAVCLEMKFRTRYIPKKSTKVEMVDTFLAYEKYIYEVFQEAIQINDNKLETKISSSIH